MSQEGLTTPSHLNVGNPVSNLTFLVLFLIPCVLLVFLLNCLFLVYKIFVASKKIKTRVDTEETVLPSSSSPSTRHRVNRTSDGPFSPPNQAWRRTHVSTSEPVLCQPVASSRTSSKKRSAVEQSVWLLRPDGATRTGSGSLRAPSTILAASSRGTSRVSLPKSSRRHSDVKMDWGRNASLPPQSSDSEEDTRVDVVPTNSPATHDPSSKQMCHIRRSSTLESLTDVNHSFTDYLFDKVDYESDYTCHTSRGTSCLNISTAGPGLDSDFGASAGVSLRILSADSDGLSNGVFASALEWDYYDPCYVQQNNLPRHGLHRPAVHVKQYWV
ncbi:protein huluwa [Lampris incognitus]|uniref:protein huluwa n=1 Tax=Lampris incognitus TaxID=2546036 RepID=UPI0024B60246|nr:protein huluwa [Lampris incognitus]